MLPLTETAGMKKNQREENKYGSLVLQSESDQVSHKSITNIRHGFRALYYIRLEIIYYFETILNSTLLFFALPSSESLVVMGFSEA